MRKESKMMRRNVIILAISFLFLFQMIFILASPEGPVFFNVTDNSTFVASNTAIVNTSGGYIFTINMTAMIQNVKWKAFIGWVDGRFVLDDAAGKTIYDWSLSSITGEVYATRSSGTIAWDTIDCATIAQMEAENSEMNHTSPQDNITATFTQQDQTHDALVVGGVTITANKCNGTLNTYVDDAEQDADFQEVVLFDGTDILYSTILEQDAQGYNVSSTYDFQMIVPENGAPGFSGKTAYYLYVELD